MEWISKTPIAHRGLHGDETPENSLEAIERAAEAGYAVEIDVRLSADGIPIVFHDRTLDRLTGETGEVHRARWETLEGLELEGTGSRIPRLSDVLDLVEGRAPVLVELKNWGDPGELEGSVAEALAAHEGPAAVQSFNPRTVAWFRRHAPEIHRGRVSGSFEGAELAMYKKVLLQRLALTAWGRPAFIAYEHAALPYWPVTLHRRLAGLPVLGWTVRSEAELDRIRPHVDNVIFEGFRP